MPGPTIKVDSTNGAKSDTLCSGAGPTTALTGTAALTNGAGTLVTLDGSPDLTNVAVDGTHVIYMSNTTAGQRRFAAISGKDNTAKTVTVSQAYPANLTGKSWAIGGVRATIGGTESRLIFENNGSTGDAKGGWTVQMQSGHTETIASTIRWRATLNSLVDGPHVIEGIPNAAVRPLLTATNNAQLFILGAGDAIQLRNFKAINTNATKTASIFAVSGSGGNPTVIDNCIVGDVGNGFFQGLAPNSASPWYVINSVIQDCTDSAILATASEIFVARSVLRRCGNSAFRTLSMTGAYGIEQSIIHGNTGSGAVLQNGNGGFAGEVYMKNNIFYGNTSHGISTSSLGTGGWISGLDIRGNIITNNGGWGIFLEGITSDRLRVSNGGVRGNAFFSNTSGRSDIATFDEIILTADPFVNAAGGDFNLNNVAGGGALLRGVSINI